MMHSHHSSSMLALDAPSSFADENTFAGMVGAATGADASVVVKPTSLLAGAAAITSNGAATMTPATGKMKKKSIGVSQSQQQQRRAFGDISNRKKEVVLAATAAPVSKASLAVINSNTAALPKTPFAAAAVSTTTTKTAVKILNDSTNDIMTHHGKNGKEPIKQHQRRVGFILPDLENNSNNNHVEDTEHAAAVAAASIQPKPSVAKSSRMELNDDHDIEMPAGRTWLQQQELDNDASDDDDDVLSVEEYLIDPFAIMAQRLVLQDEMEEQAVADGWTCLEHRMAQLFQPERNDIDNSDSVAMKSSSSMDVCHDTHQDLNRIDDEDLNLDLALDDHDDDTVILFDIPF